MQGPPTSYDVVAYPGYSHQQTRPDRLAAIGTLFGLEPKSVDACRVLELGCGDGSNLAPMASAWPGSQFLGLDLAAQPVLRGRQMIQEAGLTNIELFHADLSQFKDWGGKFDYIIAHGLYSWVPAPVREYILALCRGLLTPCGIAFVSYNAFPGAHLRTMVREMMLFHVRGCESPSAKMQQSQALLKFLLDAQDAQDEYRLWMKAELESVRKLETGHLYHDQLAEVNQPFYFTQFIQNASAHGLQYLGEADYFEMFDYGFKDPVRETLKQLGPNRLLREQYLDFLKCRTFRQTLLCHSEIPLRADPQPDKVAKFVVHSLAKSRDEVDLGPGVKVLFETPKGGKFETDYPLGKAALAVLAANDGAPLGFDELKSRAAVLAGNHGGVVEGNHGKPDELAAFLLELYGAGIVEFRTRLPAVTHVVSDRPVASPLVRWQARHRDFVTSQFHVAVKIEDEIGRYLLSLLDGTLNQGELAGKLHTFLKTKNGLPAHHEGDSQQRRRIEADLQRNLKKLAQFGLLVG